MDNFLTENQKKQLIKELKRSNFPLVIFIFIIISVFIYSKVIEITDNIQNDIPIKLFKFENIGIILFLLIVLFFMSISKNQIKQIKAKQPKVLIAMCTFKESKYYENKHKYYIYFSLDKNLEKEESLKVDSITYGSVEINNPFLLIEINENIRFIRKKEWFDKYK